MDIINEWHKLATAQKDLENEQTCDAYSCPVSWVVCGDGSFMSIQADEYKYCGPRHNREWPYYSFEIATYNCPFILEWDGCEDGPQSDDFRVYGYVDLEDILEVVNDRGGLIGEPIPADISQIFKIEGV